jgi:acetolactate synthase-1/3 small subunit
MMRHTISILFANQAGELSRIVGLFGGRGYNIDTISVGKTLNPKLSRATIVTIGDEKTVEQIVKQCAQLIRVKDVSVVASPHIEREMALINVNAATGAERQDILNLVGIFRAKVVDMSHQQIVLEASGSSDKVDTFIELLKPFGVNEVTRSGCVAINRLSPFEKTEEIEEEAFSRGL